jgi:hypothetical protein
MIKKILASLSLALVFMSCSGYQVGNMGHPQIKRVSVGKLENLSNEPRLALIVMDKIKEAIRQDGTYELVNAGEGRADAIIQGKIPQFSYRKVGFSRNDDNEKKYRVNNYRVTVKFDYEVVTPKKLVIQKFTMTGNGDFSDGVSIEQNRREGLERAAYSMATKVVTQLAEGW